MSLLFLSGLALVASANFNITNSYETESAGSPGRPEGRVVINEVMYDPQGSDTGREYVELYNPGQTPISLKDIVLESGNGARPDSWSVEWAAPPEGILNAGAYLWIGGAPEGVEGSPDQETTLHLQNGPDAARLRRGEEILDRVGWGQLEYPVYYEGSPAPDLASGEALGRVPDGADSDDNAGDFQALIAPSPGRLNRAPRTLLLEPPRAFPPVARPGEMIRWTAKLIHSGREPLPLAPASVRWKGNPLPLSLPLMIEKGIPVVLAWDEPAPLDRGFYQSELAFCLQSDTLRATGGLYAGTGPAVVTEIQYDPADGEGEWLEITVRGEINSLGGWGFEDSGERRVLIDDDRPVFKGDRYVLAEDPVSLIASRPGIDISSILSLAGGWPSLNNTVQDDLGAADYIVLLNASGDAVDFALYSPAPGAGDGVSLERRAPDYPSHPVADWVPSPAGPTPGRPGYLEQESPPAGELLITPPVLTQGNPTGCLIIPPRTPDGRTWMAEVFDISGRRVRTLGLQAREAGEPAFYWDGDNEAGRGVAPGLYVVSVKSWADGQGARQWRASLGVAP
jgi:hypothetical protein